LITVKKAEDSMNSMKRELKKFMEWAKAENDDKTKRVITLETLTSSIRNDFDHFKTYKRTTLEKINSEVFLVKDHKVKIERQVS
jgi:hypothetical protein